MATLETLTMPLAVSAALQALCRQLGPRSAALSKSPPAITRGPSSFCHLGCCQQCLCMSAEVGVRGATTYTGTHSGHFQLNPVHKISHTQRALLKRLNSPGGQPGTKAHRALTAILVEQSRGMMHGELSLRQSC